MWDFDFFTGDIVLGSMQFELVVLPLPWGDPTSAIALALSAVTTAGLIARWQRQGEQIPA